MAAGDLAREGEAEAGALNAAAERIVRAEKLFEDFFFAPSRHPAAAVENFDARHHPVRRESNIHLLFFRTVFFGVGKEIDEDLRQRVTVAIHKERLARKIAPQAKTAGFEMGAIRFACFSRQSGNVDLLEMILLLPAFEAGEVENIIDEPGQPRGFRSDDV